MNSIIIKTATLNDAVLIQQIARETFAETFAQNNSESDMKMYLDESFSIDKITAELSNSESVFYIAFGNESVLGYMKLNTGSAQTEVQNTLALEIERIYVKAAYHGKKVGQLLYEKALEVAKEDKHPYLWLGVWEENLKAIAFYRKNGFVEFDKHVFMLGSDEQIDIMMKKEI